MRLIGCRECDSAYCDGCNIYILATMLKQGKLDCLMDEHHTITIGPEELRPKGEWGKVRYLPMYDTYVSPCSNCGYESTEYHKPYCPNCGAQMRGADE